MPIYEKYAKENILTMIAMVIKIPFVGLTFEIIKGSKIARMIAIKSILNYSNY